MKTVIQSLHHSLIVSCQADEGDPFDSPESIALFAKAAAMGGAAGIRARGIENINTIKKSVDVPVIGITKSSFPDGYVRITGSFTEVEALLTTNCEIIAVDGTFREREALSGPDFIAELKKRYDITIMADIAQYDEAEACAAAGADIVATTLWGYTPDTADVTSAEPNFDLVEKLSAELSIPVIAEGKINMPSYAAEMIKRGAHAVVVGSAITRPRVITGWFHKAIVNS